MRPYTVEYKRYMGDDVQTTIIFAHTKEEAYDRAVFETCEFMPYSCWVVGVTYNNGNYRKFNTSEGNPYGPLYLYRVYIKDLVQAW